MYVGELKCVLEKILIFKYCEVECNLEIVLDYYVFVEIINELVGYVNLDFDILEMILLCLLRYIKVEYIVKWLIG